MGAKVKSALQNKLENQVIKALEEKEFDDVCESKHENTYMLDLDERLRLWINAEVKIDDVIDYADDGDYYHPPCVEGHREVEVWVTEIELHILDVCEIDYTNREEVRAAAEKVIKKYHLKQY